MLPKREAGLKEEVFLVTSVLVIIFLSCWLCRIITKWLKIHTYLSYVGIFLLSTCLSYLDYNHIYGVNIPAINSLRNFDQPLFILISTPALIISLVLRVDFFCYENHLLQISTLTSGMLGYQVAAYMVVLHVLCKFMLDCANEQLATLFIAYVSIILIPTETFATVTIMKHCTYDVIRLRNVLHGEELCSVVAALFTFNLTNLSFNEEELSFTLGSRINFDLPFGIFFGLFSYIAISKLIEIAMQDTFSNATLFIGFSYFLYLEAYAFFGRSSAITVAIFGVLYNVKVGGADHTKLEDVKKLWDIFDYVNHSTMFIMCGFIVGVLDIAKIMILFAAAVILLVCSLLVRYLVWFLIYPISELKTIKKSDLIVATLAGYKTGPPLLMSIFTQRYVLKSETQLVPITSFVVILTLLLQLLPFTAVLTFFQYFRLTDQQIYHMNTLWKRIYFYRDRAIECFTQHEMSRDANVNFIKKIITLITPRHTIGKKSLPEEKIKGETLEEFQNNFESFKKRILNIQLNIFKQREQEHLLTLPALRKLREEIKALIGTKETILRMEHISRTWSTLENLTMLVNFLEKIVIILPFYLTDVHTKYKTIAQLRVYEIIRSHLFQLCMSTCLLLDSLAICYLIMYYYGIIDLTDQTIHIFQIFNAITYFASNIEIIFEIYALGMKVFFSKKSKKLTFSQQTILRTLMYVTYIIDKNFPTFEKVAPIVIYLNILLLTQSWRVYAYISIIVHQLIKWINVRITNEVTRRLDTCNALIFCFEQLAARHIKDVNTDSQTKKQFILQMKAYKLEAIIVLGLIRKDYPTLDIGLKTRIASQYIINQMYNVFLEEKNTSLFGTKELIYYQEMFKQLNKRIGPVKAELPEKVISYLKNIKWLRPNFIEIFERNAEIRYLNFRDRIIEQASDPGGMFILVSGQMRCQYRPTQITLQRLINSGQLPNCDLLLTSNFQQPRTIKVPEGCVIGELGVVTGRRYDMNVYSATFAEVYHISQSFLLGLCHNADYSDIICGEIWHTIACKWAVFLLEKNEKYQSWTEEKLREYVERGIIVCVTPGTPLKITYYVSEVILVEGVIADPLTRKSFYAPYRIDIKSVRNLILGIKVRGEDTDVCTRVLVIPRIEATRDDILVENFYTYKGYYKYDYEEVKHIISLETKRYNTYRDEQYHWMIKRLSSSMVDLHASPPLLSSHEEFMEYDDDFNRMFMKTKGSDVSGTFGEFNADGYSIQRLSSFKDIVDGTSETVSVGNAVSSEMSVVAEKDKGEGDEEDEDLGRFRSRLIPKLSLRKLMRQKGTIEISEKRMKQTEFPQDSNIEKESVEKLAYIRKSKSEETLRTNVSERKVEPNLLSSRSLEFIKEPENLSEVYSRNVQSVTTTSSQDKQEDSTVFWQRVQEKLSKFEFTTDKEGKSVLLKMDQSSTTEQPPAVEYVNWRTLMADDRFTDKSVQTKVKTLIKPYQIPWDYDRSLNSLLSESLCTESMPRLRTGDEDSSDDLFAKTVPEIGKRYLQKEKLYLQKVDEKFPDVFKARRKVNYEVCDERIFFDNKVIQEDIKLSKTEEKLQEEIPRCKPFSALKFIGRARSDEYLSEYDIIEEDQFGESISSYSRERASQQVGKRKKPLVERKRRPLHQRKICIKQRPKFKILTRSYLKNRITKIAPRIFRTGVLEELYMVTKEQDLSIVRRRDRYVFQPPKAVWSLLCASRFPRLPTPDDSYVKTKKEARLYWSSSSSSV
ncbi:hypothetical protein O3M35_003064 [Rhynocoris fuscipes]|uniref:Uncharacterized protein n=1 Tax=Rhynocoris fuscipes TaxID=488301 RepID=A0AAW1CK53_9HEMI